jgi:hypothetical protein
MLTLVVLVFASSSGQSPGSPNDKPTAPGLIKLTGEDEKRVKQLNEQIDKATKADRWNEGIVNAHEHFAMRVRVRGPKHFETVDAKGLC